MAERYKRQTLIDFSNCQLQSAYNTYPTSEEDWANRIVWVYGHIISFCFGSEESRTHNQWGFMSKKLDDLRDQLPSSYEPIFQEQSPNGSVFPTIWFLSGWHGE